MIISLFPPCIGGAERQALLLAGTLAARGVDVSVLTRRLKNLPDFEVMQNVPVHRKIVTLPWSKLFGVTYAVSVLWFLISRRASYDIIHCHELQGFHSIAAMLVKKLLNKKVIVKVALAGQESDFAKLKRGVMGAAFLNKLKEADRLIAICNETLQEARQEDFPEERIQYIPNGVAPVGLSRKETGTSDKRLLFVGRLIRRKGAHVLLDAFKRLRDDGVQAGLDIIGEGPERSSLEDMARGLGLLDSACFHGALQDPDPYYRNAALFVLPSFAEGLPNVLLEAMARGLPVIASAAGGAIDVVEDGKNGILVDSGDIEDLYQAMKKCLENRPYAEKLGAAARETVDNTYSIHRIAQTYEALYAALVQ